MILLIGRTLASVGANNQLLHPIHGAFISHGLCWLIQWYWCHPMIMTKCLPVVFLDDELMCFSMPEKPAKALSWYRVVALRHFTRLVANSTKYRRIQWIASWSYRLKQNSYSWVGWINPTDLIILVVNQNRVQDVLFSLYTSRASYNLLCRSRRTESSLPSRYIFLFGWWTSMNGLKQRQDFNQHLRASMDNHGIRRWGLIIIF